AGWAATERRGSGQVAAAVPAVFCLWLLLSFYHLGNNMIRMSPAFVFLWLTHDAASVTARRLVVALIQLELMVDIPVRLHSWAPPSGWGQWVIVDFDRFLVALTFVYVTALWYQLR